MFLNQSTFVSLSLSTTTILLAMVVLIVMFIVLTKLMSDKTSSNRCPLPPGPTPLPLIGCTIQMLLNRPTFRWIHKLMDQYNTQILCIRFGPSTHVIVVTSPNIACEFLKTQDKVFASRPEIMSASLISDGYRTAIMSPFGEQWKKMRRMLKQEILSSQVHKWLECKRNEEANHLLKYILNQIEKECNVDGYGLVNIRITSQHFYGNMIRKMIFGRRFFGEGMKDGGPGDEETEHVTSLFTILKYLYAFCITDYLPWLRGTSDFDGHEKIMRNAIDCVRKHHDPLIDERIRMWNDGTRIDKDDLLDVLVNHENPKLTIEEIKAQILELMIAMIDNPSNAIEWALGEMINEPTLLKKAVEELDRVVGCDRLVEERDLPHLNYIKACIKETFRLHPLAPFNPPHVSMTNTIVAGYFIPKGSHVLLSRPGLGRNPNVWADPLKFDPDRHLKEEGNMVLLSDNELKMLSFSTGIRGCPGVVLGSTMTTMGLARILQGFTWKAPRNESKIKLVEHHEHLNLAKPLVVVGRPRLPSYVYANL